MFISLLPMVIQCKLSTYMIVIDFFTRFEKVSNKNYSSYTIFISFIEIKHRSHFAADNEVEQEANYKDKEQCEKCLSESLSFLSKRATLPRQSQIRFLLTLAKFTSRDETCFINLTANNVLPGLLYVSKPTDIPLEKETTILFLELLDSFLEHQSGLNGLLETKYWTYAYKVTLDHQGLDEEITTIG